MTHRLLSSLSILVLMPIWNGCQKQDTAPEPIRPVRTLRVADTGQIGGRVFPGRAEAVQSVDVAFEVPGKLIERPVLVGDKVKEGQLLAKLDPRDFENDLQAANARLKRTETYLIRVTEAAQSNAVSQQDLTDAEAQREASDADVRVKRKALADTEIFAPFDGSVAATYLENFQNVRSKQPVIRVLDLSSIELKIDVPEKLISQISQVKNIEVSFDAYPGKFVQSRITEIGTEASTTTRTFPVKLIMDQPDDFTILPGMTGQARGRAEKDPSAETTIEVPASALFESEGAEFVWLVNEADMTVHRQQVRTTGINVSGVTVGGLEPGQVVVTAGVHFLSEGQSVRALGDLSDQGPGL
jgi:RND family efflux transporter MFP subunit